MRLITRKIEQFKFKVDVTQGDIDTGQCRLASKCMEKVAIARTLMNEYGGKSDADLRVKVDAGHIKFNLRGYRWLADTPKIAKDNLIRFDRKDPVKPHNYIVVANRRTKVVPPSPERQARVNEIGGSVSAPAIRISPPKA